MSPLGPEDVAPPHTPEGSGTLTVCPVPNQALSQTRRCSPAVRAACYEDPENGMEIGQALSPQSMSSRI